MQARRILGRDQQKKQVRGPAVERIEVDAALMAPEDADDAADTGELAVGNCDAVADRGRTQPLALCEDCGQRRGIDLAVLTGEVPRQLVQDFGFGVGFVVR